MSLPVIILGAGGHARVLLDLLQLIDTKILGVCDPQLVEQGKSHWNGLSILGDDSYALSMPSRGVLLVNAIGPLPYQNRRQLVHHKFVKHGYRFATLIHPHATVSSFATLRAGTQIMAGAVIQADASIGENTIINTSATIDHGTLVGANSHIAPGATVCGDVTIGECCYIGSGATIVNGLSIGSDAIVGAGTTVIRNIQKNHLQIGAPAMEPKRIEGQ